MSQDLPQRLRDQDEVSEQIDSTVVRKSKSPVRNEVEDYVDDDIENTPDQKPQPSPLTGTGQLFVDLQLKRPGEHKAAKLELLGGKSRRLKIGGEEIAQDMTEPSQSRPTLGHPRPPRDGDLQTQPLSKRQGSKRLHPKRSLSSD